MVKGVVFKLRDLGLMDLGIVKLRMGNFELGLKNY